MKIKQAKLPTIPANRVSLRSLEERDVDSLFEVFSNSDVMRYWSSPAMKDRTEAEKYLQNIREGFERGNLFQWGVALKENDGVIGTCTLYAIDRQNRRCEIGYALNRQFWGRGLMNEAVSALIDYAFGEMKLNRLGADVDPRNSASIRALEKLGFQREGYLRENWIVNGEVQDSLIYGLLKKDWRTRKT